MTNIFFQPHFTFEDAITIKSFKLYVRDRIHLFNVYPTMFYKNKLSFETTTKNIGKLL